MRPKIMRGNLVRNHEAQKIRKASLRDKCLKPKKRFFENIYGQTNDRFYIQIMFNVNTDTVFS